MPNVVIMVHNSFTARTLSITFIQQPDTNVITVPIDTQNLQSFDSQQIHLNTALKGVGHSNKDIVIVESNYGRPGAEEINAPLLDLILKTFPGATIVATSGTAISLAKALMHNPRIFVMGKGKSPSEEEISAHLTNDLKSGLQGRILSISMLLSMLKSQTISCERRGSSPETDSPIVVDEARPRAHTSPPTTPLYGLHQTYGGASSSSALSQIASAVVDDIGDADETEEISGGVSVLKLSASRMSAKK